MIDINITLLIQLINFLVLLIILNFILFKPIRQIMKEREQGISSALGDAKNAQERMQKLLDDYNVSLAEIKQKSATTYNSIYQRGIDAQREMISAERAKAGEALDRARAEIASASAAARADIAAASAEARTDLRKEAERLSQDITSKLLGRAV